MECGADVFTGTAVIAMEEALDGVRTILDIAKAMVGGWASNGMAGNSSLCILVVGKKLPSQGVRVAKKLTRSSAVKICERYRYR